MKKYFEHIQSKTPHERRQHATQIAGSVVAAIFLVWLTTLGIRLASSNAQLAEGESNNQSQLANVLGGMYGSQENTLEVATTSIQY